MTDDEVAADQLATIWEHDLIGDRRKHAEFLHRYLTDLGEPSDGKRGFVLNIDAEWGAGKSYFLGRLKDHLEAEGHLVAFVDAWRDDFTDDPLIAVLHAVRLAFETKSAPEQVRDKFNAMAQKGLKVAGTLAAGLLKRQAYRLVGDAVNEVFDPEDDKAVKAKGKVGKASEDEETDLGADVEAAMATAFERMGAVGAAEESAFTEARKVIDEFTESLRQLADAVRDDEDAKAPIFILIDELDRCRPTYAIELLERVKHIFEAAGVVFIIATDTKQLSHSVKAVYGEGFDGRKYLQRFFDQTYSLPIPVGIDLVRVELERHSLKGDNFYEPPNAGLEEQLSDVLAVYGANARLTKRALMVFASAVKTRGHDNHVFAPYLMMLALAHCDPDQALFASLAKSSAGGASSSDFKQWLQERAQPFEKRQVIIGFGSRHEVEYDSGQLIVSLLENRNRDLRQELPIKPDNGETFTPNGYVAHMLRQDKRSAPQKPAQENAHLSSFADYPMLVKAAGSLSELVD